MRAERLAIPGPRADDVPLVVDLDGTLVRGDVAVESMMRVARMGLQALFGMLLCLLRGRSALKTWLARRAPVDPAKLAYRPEVLALIAQARHEHRPVVLATAAHWRTARRVADYLGGFDTVVASTRRANRKGVAKLACLRAEMRSHSFDYVGDAPADRPIWRGGRKAYTVGVATHTSVETRLTTRPGLAHSLLKAARPHQWAKNLLVFVPLATSGRLVNPAAIGSALMAFGLLSVIASAIYLVNDVLDIDADRAHARKQRRPIAAGDLPIPAALAAALLGAAGGLCAGWMLLGTSAFAALAEYCALTIAYSLRLKSAMIADVLTLACLYTLRIVAGAAAIGVPVSSWLLLFSVFFFLSLGYLKRYVELLGSARESHELLNGRGYIRSDGEIVAMSGIAAGMVAILVIVLFAEAMGRTGTYGTPQLLWLLPLPLLYWLNRIWMMGRRGEVDSDPVAFAIRDRRSLVVGACLATILLAAKFAVLPVQIVTTIGG